MAAQQAELELLASARRDRLRDEPPEARVDRRRCARARRAPRGSTTSRAARMRPLALVRDALPRAPPTAAAQTSSTSARRPVSDRSSAVTKRVYDRRGSSESRVDPGSSSRRGAAAAGRRRRPAGIRPTSSEPATSTPRAAASASMRATISCSGGRLPVLDVHAHLDEPGARQLEAERAHAGEAAARSRTTAAIARATSTSSVARLTLNAISGRACADEDCAGARIEPRRARVRRELAGVDPLLELRRARRAGRSAGPRPARARRRGTPAGRAPADPSASASAAASRASCRSGQTATTGTTSAAPTRGCDALVPAQVDELARARDARDERVDELRVRRRRA